MTDSACRICASNDLEEIRAFRSLARVTSDCAPFRVGGRLLVCQRCGAAQSPADAQWLGEIEEIYRAYQMFHQSGGVDQHIADPATGQFQTRTSVLARNLLTTAGAPKQGALVDIGCGTGVMLRAFSELGGWRLNGLDLDQRNLPLLRSIPGFETLYTCPAAELPGPFDLVTMVHSLEHFPEPAAVLADLRGKIAPGGRLFVEVPNAEANPFEYLVADHMVHFSAVTLARLAGRAGYAVENLSTGWVTKELSLVARPGAASDITAQPGGDVASQVDWLLSFVEQAREAARGNQSFGLFGTAIAATWLCQVLGDSVSFFVDEDKNRQGRTHMGRPIVAPEAVRSGSVVYLALIPQIANHIAPRLEPLGIDYRLPPQLGALTLA